MQIYISSCAWQNVVATLLICCWNVRFLSIITPRSRTYSLLFNEYICVCIQTYMKRFITAPNISIFVNLRCVRLTLLNYEENNKIMCYTLHIHALISLYKLTIHTYIHIYIHTRIHTHYTNMVHTYINSVLMPIQIQFFLVHDTMNTHTYLHSFIHKIKNLIGLVDIDHEH